MVWACQKLSDSLKHKGSWEESVGFKGCCGWVSLLMDCGEDSMVRREDGAACSTTRKQVGKAARPFPCVSPPLIALGFNPLLWACQDAGWVGSLNFGSVCFGPSPQHLGSWVEDHSSITHLVLMYLPGWSGNAQVAWWKPKLLATSKLPWDAYKSLDSFRVLGGPFCWCEAHGHLLPVLAC